MVALLLALPSLGLGALGAYSQARYGSDGLGPLRAQLMRGHEHDTSALAVGLKTVLSLDPLARWPVLGAFGASGLVLLGIALTPWRRARSASDDEAAESESAGGIEPSRKERGRLLKVAEQMAEQEGAEVAAGFLLGQGLKDEAFNLFMKAESFDRAAEVRYDQNRFEEAADLYRKAGRSDAAAGIYAQIESFEEAAECYVASGKHSLAAEMFERASRFADAGRCYREIGFHRHAAQAFLKGGSDSDAADALLAAFLEEGGGRPEVNDTNAQSFGSIA